MIRFALNCSSDHGFEGWFRSGEAFAEQAEAGRIACPTCGDTAVRKAVMAPAVVRSGKRGNDAAPALPAPAAPAVGPTAPEAAKAAFMVAMARKFREHVERNSEDVGGRFAEEVRRMHDGEAEKRDVHGQATLAEARDLLEEGIPILPLPELPKLDG